MATFGLTRIVYRPVGTGWVIWSVILHPLSLKKTFFLGTLFILGRLGNIGKTYFYMLLLNLLSYFVMYKLCDSF